MSTAFVLKEQTVAPSAMTAEASASVMQSCDLQLVQQRMQKLLRILLRAITPPLVLQSLHGHQHPVRQFDTETN